MNSNKNYKLEKKIKRNDLDDQIEIINSYYAANHRIHLPIENHSKELLYVIQNSQVTVIIGETGCGKTTKIPEYLSRCYSNYKVAHILPRRIATISVADRVAKNMGLTLGKEVGYSVRFDYNYSDNTLIKFLTEGMFIRELLIDPLLSQYNSIIIDDCHERTINSELIFGFLKKIFKKRADIKIIISSATLDYKCYLNFFSPLICNLFVVKGRMYPVEIFYTEKPCKNYVESAVITALNIHKQTEINSGDILVFLTGQEDINLFIDYANNYHLDKNVLLLPLCAGLPIERQLEVFKETPHNKRKVVISTNIAEASVTIENIAYVIDSCLVKMKFYNTKCDSDALYIIPASKFSLDQRSGRAGRTRPGQCFRLITEKEYLGLYQMTNPELMRSNLLEFVLRLKSFGVRDLNKFETITQIDKNSISRALESLFYLGVIDDQTNLTADLGLKVCDIPIDARLSVAIFKASQQKFPCVEEVLIISAMLSITNLFLQPNDPSNLMKAKQRLGVLQGDHLTLLNIYRQHKSCRTSKSKFCRDIYLNENGIRQVDEIITNLKHFLKKHNITVKSSLDDDGEDILKSFLKGFFLNVAQKQSDGSYRSLRWNIPLYIHPTSVLYTIMPEFVLFNEVVITAKNYIKDVSQIEKKWILECAPHFYEDKTNSIIRERHKEEVAVSSNSTKLHVNKEKLNSNSTNTNYFSKSTDIVAEPGRNKIYMEVDKNKDYSFYFEDSEDETTGHIRLDNCNTGHIKHSNNITNSAQNEFDNEEITMLRRMRKRK